MKVSLRGLLLAIALLTAFSGAIQMLHPAFVLRLVGGPDGPAPRFFFGILGMFMLLFGGLAFHALRASQALPIRWAAWQKLGAAGAVGLGVARGFFGSLAMLVAAFDLLTGILFLVYLRHLTEVGRGPR